MGQWPYSYTRRRSESSNFLPMKNTWVLWCWVDTSHSVKTRSYKYRWNVLKCIYAFQYFSTFVQMFYITSDFIQSFFCFNWPVWKRNSGWAPCCVALEIWTVQLFCHAKSQEEKWIMQLDSTHFSWVSACLSSARLVFLQKWKFYFETDNAWDPTNTGYETCAVVRTCRCWREPQTGMVQSWVKCTDVAAF